MKKNAQISLGDAPNVVLIVGLTFLLMATLAYIGYQYQQGFGAGQTATFNNETASQALLATGYTLTGASLCNGQGYSIVRVLNSTTGPAISSGNYSLSSTGILTNTTNTFSTASWLVTYTSKYAGAECNITNSLNTTLSNNTSIAGIVLTIALVGIVLAILIGVFVMVGQRRM
jgi:hypothetical protein